mmetsp:Transcript_69339/g.80929  ORF Transcript_69339/g.80929 Transcript_69339/m.80929 type:complete len:620 (-) Transcript_69339:236-2095(-)|eukprot:CAMPEP_0176424052 /NCGR_PEP_ID=MMETSP0127-20121128/10626_1 /TAXON_ID=938130 /ORGANISM="Platyophrya macrostoma, Strain WH" /LENGTH=619 /DNA_ID=CAMNT_0017805073 /DNA_START=49 /DNA_END=1908 /DNA_ORIENTATION=-
MTGVGKTHWVQSSDEDDVALEIRIPVVLPPGVRTKELTIVVKDEAVLCVKHKDTSLVQWRLYSTVSDEVEWRAEQEAVVVDLQKKEGGTWPCLLNLPMRGDDKLLLTESELDALFSAEVKALPPVKKVQPKEDDGTEDGTEEKPAGEDDLDRLLEETVEEIQELDMFVKAELKGMEEEETEMRAKLRELEEAVPLAETEEARESALKQVKLVEKMLEIHAKTRELRSYPCTLKLFLETQLLDLMKSRVNVGELSDTETEPFLREEEKELTPHQLLQVGVQLLQEQELEKAIHFLRIAAVHHKHPQSISILFRIYSELGSPRGAFLLLQRAKDDEDVDVTTNLQVAEMFDRGARHFPPIFGAAIHFYQRAARNGSVHAMMGLAQLYLRGSTSATTLNETERKANVNLEKYHAWLQQALDRGAGAAYFVKGCMHLRGEHGLEKSYAEAKDYITRARQCQPEIAKRAAGIDAALDRLRIEEEATAEGGAESAVAASPETPSSPSSPPQSPATGASSVKANAAPKVTAAARLAALEEKTAGAALSGTDARKPAAKKVTVSHAAAAARSRVFWERTVVVGTAVYSIWSLAFPIRVMLLPHFYNVLMMFMDSFGIGSSSSSSMLM